MVFKHYGLSIVLSILFFLVWVGQGVLQYHDQPAEISQFVPEFIRASFEDQQAEFFQLSAFALLSLLVKKESNRS